MNQETEYSSAGEPEPRRGQRLWTVIAALPYVIPVALLLSLTIAIILVAIGGYMYKWGWTGFAGKTLWDWMKLLIVPLILAVGGLLITQMERLNSARAQALDRERLEVDRRQTQQRLALEREQAEQDRRLSEQGQITQRFTQAIEQLEATDDKGEKKLEIRLGGIYALERIAVDSPERDYSTVMEVLTAYVGENTSQASVPSKGFSDAASTSNEGTTEADEGAKQPFDPPEPRRPAADIQAILDVLSRAQARVPEEYRTRLDLHEANLQGAYLLGAILQGANLLEANLEEAFLDKAHLDEANLRRASMSGAKGVTIEELEQQTASFEGTTMPNGQKYEDWLKDRE